jgi:hypothetical protein
VQLSRKVERLIIPGAILIERGTLLPQSFRQKNESYPSAWMSIKQSQFYELENELATTGWTFFYMAGGVRDAAKGGTPSTNAVSPARTTGEAGVWRRSCSSACGCGDLYQCVSDPCRRQVMHHRKDSKTCGYAAFPASEFLACGSRAMCPPRWTSGADFVTFLCSLGGDLIAAGIDSRTSPEHRRRCGASKC